MIGIIDTGICNYRSMEVSIERLEYETRKVTCQSDTKGISKCVFPGVGSFKAGMGKLSENGLDQVVRTLAEQDMPILGVCLGMQIMCSFGEEFGHVDGLDLVAGKIVKLDESRDGMKVPNIGWYKVRAAAQGQLHLNDDPYFYFVHSFHVVPDDPSIVTGTISLGGEDVVVAYEKDNIFGVQFHPEKSQDAGLEMLQSFLRI